MKFLLSTDYHVDGKEHAIPPCFLRVSSVSDVELVYNHDRKNQTIIEETHEIRNSF